MARCFYRFLVKTPLQKALGPRRKSVPVMAAMPVVTMVPMAAVMPAMMPAPAVVTMPAVMAAPVNFLDVFRRLFCRCRCRRIDKRYRLRTIGRRGNREQPGDSRKSEDRPDVHLHEFSPLVGGFESQLRRWMFRAAPVHADVRLEVAT